MNTALHSIHAIYVRPCTVRKKRLRQSTLSPDSNQLGLDRWLNGDIQSALHITATVSLDNRLEVQLPPGSEGQEVDVFIVLSTSTLNTQARYSDLAEMAADPDIQREMAAINAEFLVAEMDGFA